MGGDGLISGIAHEHDLTIAVSHVIVNHNIHTAVVADESSHVGGLCNRFTDVLGLLEGGNHDGVAGTDRHGRRASNASRGKTQCIRKHGAGLHGVSKRRNLRSDDQQTTGYGILDESTLSGLIQPVLRGENHGTVAGPALRIQVGVRKHIAHAAGLQRFVECVEVIALLAGDDGIEAELLIRHRHSVRVLGESGRSFQEVAGEGDQHGRGLKTVVFAVGQQQHVAAAAQVAEIDALENLVHGLVHLGHRTNGSVTANRREEPLVAFDDHIAAETLDTL